MTGTGTVVDIRGMGRVTVRVDSGDVPTADGTLRLRAGISAPSDAMVGDTVALRYVANDAWGGWVAEMPRADAVRAVEARDGSWPPSGPEALDDAALDDWLAAVYADADWMRGAVA